MPIDHAAAPAAIDAFRARIDDVLTSFLDERRAELEALDPEATLLVDEVRRLVAAGGKRLRPVFCVWGYRAAGGRDDDRIERAGAAIELLHTMALIHDDLMDGTGERRGVPTSRPFLAGRLSSSGAERGDPDERAASLTLLAGDLAAVLADRLFLASGFPPDRLVVALERYGAMRTEMAAGQALDLLGVAGDDPDRAARIATLRGGRYTVDGPLTIGALLADARPPVLDALAAYAEPLGGAFQLADDLRDRDDRTGRGRTEVERLVAEATAALDGAPIDGDAVAALRVLAELVGSP